MTQTVSRITSAGVLSIAGELDEVTRSGSAQFSGSNYLDIASTAAFGFGTSDLTIEFWWRPTVNQRSDVLDFWSTGLGAGITGRFDIGRVTGSTLDLYTDSPVGGGGSGVKITGPSIASLLNAWHHIAITRQSGSIKMWVNGTQAGSTYSARVLDMGSSMQLRIMGDHNASGNGSGNLTNVRVVKGTAVYTSTFTPPTSPLSVITGTQLLLLQDSNDNLLKDSSTNNFTVTNNGAVTWSATSPSFVSSTSIRLTPSFLYSNEFDEVTLNPIENGLAKREYRDGRYQVAGYFDEYTGF